MGSSDWVETSLAEVLGRTFAGAWGEAPSDAVSANVRVLRATNIDSEGRVEYESPAFRVFSDRELTLKRMMPGDLILEASGGGPGVPVGRVALHEGGNSEATYACSNFFRVLRPNLEVVDPAYLKIVLVKAYRSPDIWRYQQQTTGLVNLRFKDYLRQSLVLPPLGEQRRIVEVIEAASRNERAIEESIAKLRSVRQGLLQVFMDRLARDEISVDWRPVREVGSVRMGKQLSPDSRAAGGQFPYLRVANVLAGAIDYSDVKSMGFTPSERSTYQIQPGDILLNEGQSLELVGRSAIYKRAAGEYCFQNTLVRFRASKGLDPDYAQVVFGHWLRTGVFASIAKQTTSIAHLGGDRFGVLSFPLVSPDDQANLVSVIGACDGGMESERDELARLRLLKQGLVDDLLAGECPRLA